MIAADNPIAEHVRTFVNNGGRFLSYYTGGTTSARNVGLTLLNTEPIRDAQGNELEVITPGSTYDGEFDTANPLAWGFDKGGFLYRDQENNNAIYAPASLAGGTGTGNTVVPPATAPIRYKVGGKSYGYEQNSIGPGKLDGRPAVVDQPFGAGRAFLFAGDPFFRAWNESVERQALNALLYPAGALIPADPPSGAAGAAPVTAGLQARAEAKAEYTAALTPTADPIPAKQLPELVNRPIGYDDRSGNDVKIRVWKFDNTALRKAVTRQRWPKAVKKQVRYVTKKDTVTLVIKGVRAKLDQHERNSLLAPLLRDLKRAKVKPLLSQM